MIVALMLLGIFTVNNSPFELNLMIGFGIFGYFAEKLRFPLAPMILGVILGGTAEINLRAAILISGGDWIYLGSSFISQLIIGLILLVMLVPLRKLIRSRRAAKRKS
jgi:putative tricarboxylic transport membrane protein